MFYVVKTSSGKIVTEASRSSYKTERAAKASVTRLCNKASFFEGELKVVAAANYTAPMVTKVNLITGKEYQEDVNTPNCCSPSSETYWSM